MELGAELVDAVSRLDIAGVTALLDERAEVQAALGGQLEALSTFYEHKSAGRDHLQLDQWLGALEGKLLFSDLLIDGYTVRLTAPLGADAAATRDGDAVLFRVPGSPHADPSEAARQTPDYIV